MGMGNQKSRICGKIRVKWRAYRTERSAGIGAWEVHGTVKTPTLVWDFPYLKIPSLQLQDAAGHILLLFTKQHPDQLPFAERDARGDFILTTPKAYTHAPLNLPDYGPSVEEAQRDKPLDGIFISD